jgi:SAM-dependent methyltransferase
MDAYLQIYRIMDTSKSERETILEVGSAGGVAKSYSANVITSDIREGSGVDLIFNALELPFEDESLDQIWLKDVLHHLEDPYKFFDEARRTLKPEGTLSIAETYWGPIAKFVYKYLHPEIYDRGLIERDIFTHEGNQALAEVLFASHSTQFETAMKKFNEIQRTLVNGPAWLLSGGATLTTPIPASWLRAIHYVEEKFQILKPFWSLNVVVVLRKTR